MYAVIKVGVLLEGEHKGWCIIHVQQEPWGKHKKEIVRVFESPSRHHTVVVAERLSGLLGLNVYYSDHVSMQEFLEREDGTR
jgi:hypothetical protein